MFACRELSRKRKSVLHVCENVKPAVCLSFTFAFERQVKVKIATFDELADPSDGIT